MSTKVVHMTSVHPVVDPRIVLKECTTLSRAGYDVTLVAAHDGPVGPHPVRVVTVPRGGNRAVRMTWTAFRVFLAALRERAAVYHMHDPELLPWGQVLRLLGKRVIFDMHENRAVDSNSKEWRHPKLGRLVSGLFNRLEPLLLSGISVVFAEDSYQAHYPVVKRWVAIRNLPLLGDLLAIRESKHSTFTLGYMGAISTDRGSEVTLRAMRILKDRGHDVSFDCIGPISESHRVEVETLAKELGVDRITLPGFIEAREGWRRMARCHVGLAVLRARPNYVESYPTKLFEYMALGLPVAVSDFPLYRSVLADAPGGAFVDPNDPVQLADVIERVIRDPASAEKAAARNRAIVQERFSWATEGEKLVRFYREVLPSTDA